MRRRGRKLANDIDEAYRREQYYKKKVKIEKCKD